ncbi:MAG TPA: hypothetical protein VFG29_05175 [Syntrophales bacterium]|nr:hypothetical protein [Syntrophales bacterium]
MFTRRESRSYGEKGPTRRAVIEGFPYNKRIVLSAEIEYKGVIVNPFRILKVSVLRKLPS